MNLGPNENPRDDACWLGLAPMPMPEPSLGAGGWVSQARRGCQYLEAKGLPHGAPALSPGIRPLIKPSPAPAPSVPWSLPQTVPAPQSLIPYHSSEKLSSLLALSPIGP